MNGGCKQKCDANFFKALADQLGRQLNIDAQRLHYVGGAALRADGLAIDFWCGAAIAVLGNANTASGYDEGGHGRDVECSSSVAPCAAGINQRFAASAAGVEHRICLHVNGSGGGADCFGKTDDLLDRLALHVKANQQGRDLRVGALAGEYFAHDFAGLSVRERLAVVHNSVQRFQDHRRLQAVSELIRRRNCSRSIDHFPLRPK